jgi:perosamine synthetase
MGAEIPITRPYFGEEELRAVQRPLESGWVVQGPYVREFEMKFARYTGAPEAVATTSCTTALHLALLGVGLGPGDEVIVPAFTWVSTANVVEYEGATPRFCDVRLSDYNIDPDQLEALVGRRTVGIIPVHLFGLCADMDAVERVAERHGIWVIEDAACALGAYHRGRHAGTLADAGCFSFHPRKSITTGEGGMLTTAREDVAAGARSLRDHGASRSDLARHQTGGAFRLAEYDRLGYNYRMTDIQGALGSVQMDRADWVLAERTRRAERYGQLLEPLEWLDAPQVPDGLQHGWQAYVCLFRPEEPTLANVASLQVRRDELMRRLEAVGIATRPGTHAPVEVGYYASKYGFRPGEFPGAHLAERLSLTLPLYPDMTEGDQDRVVNALVRCFETGP